MSEAMTDAEVLGSVATVTHGRWREMFAMPLWTRPAVVVGGGLDVLIRYLYELGLVVPFDWPCWHSPDRYPQVRDSKRRRLHVRVDRLSEGVPVGGLKDGSISAAVARLWSWYRQATVGNSELVDTAECSADGVYRWLYERRPARRSAGLGATRAPVIVIRGRGPPCEGPRVGEAPAPRRAFGSSTLLANEPMWVGVTKKGEPRHPLRSHDALHPVPEVIDDRHERRGKALHRDRNCPSSAGLSPK